MPFSSFLVSQGGFEQWKDSNDNDTAHCPKEY